MMRRLLPLLILVLWAGASPARDFPPRRFSLSLLLGGYAPSDTNYSNSYGGPGFMTGLRFTYTIKRRIDLDLGLEFFLKDNTKDFTRITWFAGVLTPSARYRFFNTSRFQPYLGGGLPLVDLNGMYLIVDPNRGNLAVAKVHHSGSGLVFLGGADVMLANHFALFAEARFYSLRFLYDRWELGGVSVAVDPPIEADQSGGYYGAGLRYRF